MKQEILTVVSNKKLNNSTYEMVLEGLSEKQFSGQFIELKIDGKFLRRPFSVADYSCGKLTLLYKVVGVGTEIMTNATCGDKFDALISLGNKFNIEKTDKPILIGGGIGVAPMFGLCKRFAERGIKPTVILGFRNSEEVFYLDEFKKYAEVIVTTDDGSVGLKGNAVEALKTLGLKGYYYACGPMIMLKFLSAYSTDGELSLEARMGCGFGACMGCSIKTTNGFKRVCKEGPVFASEEIIYD